MLTIALIWKGGWKLLNFLFKHHEKKSFLSLVPVKILLLLYNKSIKMNKLCDKKLSISLKKLCRVYVTGMMLKASLNSALFLKMI